MNSDDAEFMGEPICEMASAELFVSEQRKDLEKTLDKIARALQPEYEDPIRRDYVDNKFSAENSLYRLATEKELQAGNLAEMLHISPRRKEINKILEIADYTLELPDGQKLIPVASYAPTIPVQSVISKHINEYARRWNYIILIDSIPHRL